MDLFTQRAQLIQAVSALEEKELWKGSDAWRAHQAAKKALDQFDLDHPGVVMELYARFEEYTNRLVEVDKGKSIDTYTKRRKVILI